MLKVFTRLAALGLAACFAGPVVAADPAPEATEREAGAEVKVGVRGVQVEVDVDRDKPRRAAEDPKERTATRQVQQGKQMGAYRSEDLLSLKVKNAQGKELGDIEDIVVNAHDGKVQYAALSFGGFLGLGDKLFAIPWDALRMKKTDDSTYFVLNVTKEKLEKAPGFDEDNWPDFANVELTTQIDAYYGAAKERKERRQKDQLDKRDPQAREQNKNISKLPSRIAAGQSAGSQQAVYRVSELNGMAIYNHEKEQVAEIEDIVIDIDEGKVRYVAVAFDDSWGFGETLFAMPFKALKFQQQGEQTMLTSNVTQAQMKNAEGFEDDDWPNFADREWQTEIDQFYLDVPGAEVKID